MQTANYQDLVAQLCAAQPGCDPAGLLTSEHLQLDDGALVGLIPGADGQLDVFIEIAQTYPGRDVALYRRLLATNLRRAGLPLRGCFGLHPVSHAVAYCMRLPVEIGGAALARVLAEQIPLAREAFSAASRPS